MNFLNRLDKIISEQDQEQALNMSHTNTIKTQKVLADFQRAADKTSDSLEDLKRVFLASGMGDNEAIKPFVEQLEALSVGLKQGGDLRKNFESILSVSNMIGK
jgi:hypothetical protein